MKRIKSKEKQQSLTYKEIQQIYDLVKTGKKLKEEKIFFYQSLFYYPWFCISITKVMLEIKIYKR